MSEKITRAAARKPRADAERNRLLLLDVAKTIFAEKGSQASLEEIARRAGVGIGTLYRHFPTRDALIEAVYHNESEQLARAARTLAETEPPVEALRQWMLLFIEYMATKHGMYEALNSLAGGTSELFAGTAARTKEAIDLLVGRTVESGEIEIDIDPLDLLRALAGVSNISAGPNWRQSARSLVDILIAGLRRK
ncbi:AcrR family transcriptional regulator [Pararhizobium capsulatum DSM 1112]|uniref:AcrR family transcriptional regulator n=1 Tax=Pararhizobium capsulatum DSM 1112 TaxID=1121113 RepID=A0ABU0BWP1_9HYPH|nr:TetR/AcrR family transcriptional regulator [Pararhizobium capsulatum]MDQ0322680.1 AcrR family transcriptional regulator [Pararhizobium capsulatum DSM 1112]